MIKINRDFDKLANEHKEKIKSDYEIEQQIKDKAESEKAKIKEFYEFLQKNLDLVLTSKPDNLNSVIIPEVKRILGNEFFVNDKKVNKPTINELKKIFNYDLFIDYKKKKYCAYSLVKSLNIQVCPYCNRQYTTTLRPENKKGGTRPTLDHFYLKSDYPYLALSFWNLIPACYSCNSQLRGTRKIGLHPYEKGFEKILHFYTGIESVENFIGNSKQDILIALSAYKKQKPNTSDLQDAMLNYNVFRLEALYQQNHQEDVRELIQRAIIYNKSFSKSLFEQYTDLFDNEYDARRTMLANYTTTDGLEKRPLAKLTKDICEELGVF
jgi:hypothetical protein